MDYNATAELRDELDELLPAEVVVTMDYAQASSAVNAGKLVAFLTPPRSEFPTHNAAETEYRIVLASGLDDTAVGFDLMTGLIPLLVRSLDVSEARPAGFQPQQGPTLNAYEVTLHRSYNL